MLKLLRLLQSVKFHEILPAVLIFVPVPYPIWFHLDASFLSSHQPDAQQPSENESIDMQKEGAIPLLLSFLS